MEEKIYLDHLKSRFELRIILYNINYNYNNSYIKTTLLNEANNLCKIIRQMILYDGKDRPSCAEVLNDQAKWTIDISCVEISQHFIDYINSISSEEKSKYYLAKYIKYYLNEHCIPPKSMAINASPSAQVTSVSDRPLSPIAGPSTEM